jgi:hypothetical protein
MVIVTPAIPMATNIPPMNDMGLALIKSSPVFYLQVYYINISKSFVNTNLLY